MCYEQDVEGADQGAICVDCDEGYRLASMMKIRRSDWSQSSDDDDEVSYQGTNQARLQGSEVVKFYTDKNKTLLFNNNSERLSLSQLLDKPNQWLKDVHDWVQIVSPGREESSFVERSPVLSADEIVQIPRAAILATLTRLQRYFEETSQQRLWTRHENRRVTRLIKLLRLRGLRQEAVSFYERILQLEEDPSREAKEYWREATKSEPVGFRVLGRVHVKGDGNCLFNSVKAGLATLGLSTEGIERVDLLNKIKSTTADDSEARGMFLVELLEDEVLGTASEFKELLTIWKKDLSTGDLNRNQIPERLWTWMKCQDNYWFGYAGISAICHILETRQISLYVWQRTSEDPNRMNRVFASNESFTTAVHILRSAGDHFDFLSDFPEDP